MKKMYTISSLTTCVLVFSIIVSGTADLIACHVPLNFTTQISNNERAELYQSELTVTLENDSLTVTSYPGINTVHVQANNVVVAFKGYMVVNDAERGVATQPERISQISVDRLFGIAPQAILNSTDSAIRNCRLVLLPTETTNRSKVNVRIANEIRRLAESCTELKVCERIGETKSQDLVVSQSRSGPGLLSVYTDPLAVTTTPPRNLNPEDSEVKLSRGTIQSAINKLVDIALAEIIEKLREKNEGTVTVPNIDREFSTGSGIFETTGRFEAVDGRLRDLTTIRRITDATLSHEGIKFVASCGFGLGITNLNYDHYRLKYGVIKVYGKMSGDINGMALEARVAADYTQTPCVMSLENLNVTEFGKMKIHVTGLSPLNSLVSSLLNWVTEKWRDDVVHMVEKKLRKSVDSRLSSFNCERFRP